MPGVGLYASESFAPGFWTLFGLDRESGSKWSAALRTSYSSPDWPLQLSAGLRKILEGSEHPSYYGQVGVEAYKGTLSLWARKERYLASDAGESIGATRRFGQTFVTISALRTHYPEGIPYFGGPLEKIGIDLQFPLPRTAVDIGKVRIATNATANFAYMPTVRTAPPNGLGELDKPLLTPETLTGRYQLTALQIKQRIGEIQKRS